MLSCMTCNSLFTLPDMPANEVCEGYVFTGVCLFTGGSQYLSSGGVCARGFLSRGSLSRGVSVQGVSVQGEGSLCLGGRVSIQGGLCPGRTQWTETAPRTEKSGRYASYWNAFLFTLQRPIFGTDISTWIGIRVCVRQCNYAITWMV